MLNLKNIKSLLVGIDKNLNEAASLCLIGSAATILLGQPKRTTENIDLDDLPELHVTEPTATPETEPKP